MSDPAIDLEGMTPEERLRLIERVWDSLSDDDVPLTDAQRRELDRRLDDLERMESRGIPWDEVLKRLESGAP